MTGFGRREVLFAISSGFLAPLLSWEQVFLLHVACLLYLACAMIKSIILRPQAWRWYLTPAAFMERDLLETTQIASSLAHMVKCMVILGTFLSMLPALRLWAEVKPFLRKEAVENAVLGSWPESLVLRLRDGSLQAEPPLTEAVKLPIPPRLFEFFGGGGLAEVVDSMDVGIADLTSTAILANWFLGSESFSEAWGEDPYVRVAEFFEGDVVEVRSGKELRACLGRHWQLTPPPFGVTWHQAVVEEVSASTRLNSFAYFVRFAHGTAGAETSALRAAPASDCPTGDSGASEARCQGESLKSLASFDGIRCKVQAKNLRRPAPIAVLSLGHAEISHDDASVLSWDASGWLPDVAASDRNSAIVFAPSRFAVLDGWSHAHGSHWQYRHISSESSGASATAKLWHTYTDDSLFAYAPLAACITIFCKRDPPDEPAAWQCSRRIGKDNLDAFLAGFPIVETVLSLEMHVPAVFLILWCAVVSTTIVARTAVVLCMYVPVGFCSCALLRHVDTPVLPLSRVFGLVMYSAVPVIALKRICLAVIDTWGEDHVLPPALERALDAFAHSHMRLILIWAAWVGYLAIRIRGNAQQRQHAARVAAGAARVAAGQTRRPRSSPCTLDSAAAAVGTSINRSDADGDHPHGIAADASDAAAGTEVAAPTAGAAAARGAGASVGGGDAAAAAEVVPLFDVDDDEPSCRICFGGREGGRLISPCLCAGTQRFVHLDCLNMWRAASANPRSFYQCDACQYRYSLQRTMVANIFRSALVLHILSLTAFMVAVLICSLVALLLDKHGWGGQSFGKGWTSTISDEWLEQIANDTEVQAADLREQLASWADMSWHGLHLFHLISGFAMVGIGGLASIGFVWFPFFGRRGTRFVEGPLLILTLLVGALRVMWMIYSLFKGVSAKLLQSAESLILDVGAGVDVEFPERPPAAVDAAVAGVRPADVVLAGAAPAVAAAIGASAVAGAVATAADDGLPADAAASQGCSAVVAAAGTDLAISGNSGVIAAASHQDRGADEASAAAFRGLAPQ